MYLIDLLLEKLQENQGRIINVIAPAYQLGEIRYDDIYFDNVSEEEFKPADAYSQSKLALMLYTREKAKDLEGMKKLS